MWQIIGDISIEESDTIDNHNKDEKIQSIIT
jgi:hypothetical protein